MRGRSTGWLALGIACSLALAACGGDDDGDDTAPTATAAPTTTIVAPIDPDRCEETPDPDDYPPGEVPTALRPCQLPDGPTSQVIRAGDGRAAEVGDGVIFHATIIRSDDGELVDSSWTDGDPNNLPSVGTGDTITGLDSNLVGVQVGEVLRLDIPATPDTAATIPDAGVAPADPLSYVIEVVAVVPQLDPDDVPRNISVDPSTGATEVTTEDLVVGDGKVVEADDVAIIAMLLARGDNEVILVNSWHQGSPQVISLDPDAITGAQNVTLPGLVEGLQGARVGGRRVITIPAADAWGEGGSPMLGLPPNTDVIVVADILAAY